MISVIFENLCLHDSVGA